MTHDVPIQSLPKGTTWAVLHITPTMLHCICVYTGLYCTCMQCRYSMEDTHGHWLCSTNMQAVVWWLYRLPPLSSEGSENRAQVPAATQAPQPSSSEKRQLPALACFHPPASTSAVRTLMSSSTDDGITRLLIEWMVMPSATIALYWVTATSATWKERESRLRATEEPSRVGCEPAHLNADMRCPTTW